MTERTPAPGQVWRHYKGGVYRVLHKALINPTQAHFIENLHRAHTSGRGRFEISSEPVTIYWVLDDPNCYVCPAIDNTGGYISREIAPGTEAVVYISHYNSPGNTTWVRPLASWLGDAIGNGGEPVHRFERLS